jgi:hypothetical protein
MFDRAVTDTPAAPTVIQALTSGLQNKNRRSNRRDNGFRNPRKMHEEVGRETHLQRMTFARVKFGLFKCYLPAAPAVFGKKFPRRTRLFVYNENIKVPQFCCYNFLPRASA